MDRENPTKTAEKPLGGIKVPQGSFMRPLSSIWKSFGMTLLNHCGS